MSPRVYWPLALLVVVVLGAVWFLQTFERVPAKERVPASGEARLREFLAAERFAERMGLPSRELRSLADLDGLVAGGVLVMPNARQAIEGQRVAQLVKWVEAGGHAIVEAELLGVDDPLLAALGVERESRASVVKPLSAEVDGRKLVAAFRSRIALRTAAQPVLRMEDQLVTFARGEGLVSATTSLDFARNDWIGANDHAALLWTLLALGPAPVLEVYFHPQRLSLRGFLIEHAAPALAAGVALLLFWLWRIVPRFGPVAEDPAPARRRLLDHLRASGRYLWSQGLRGHLAAAARDSALRRLARAQPDFSFAPPQERAARVARLAAISPQEARQFLAAGGGPLRGGEFIRLAAIAQRLHFALERGSR